MEGHAKLGPRVRVLCWMSSYRHERESRATTYRQLAQNRARAEMSLSVQLELMVGMMDGMPCPVSSAQSSYHMASNV